MILRGGTGVMLTGALLAAVACVGLAAALRRRLGWPDALVWAGLVWWVVVIGLVTLVPAQSSVGIVPAEGRQTTCSWDIGGPAPTGFWMFDGGQRVLNTILFVPAGVLVSFAVTRWRGGWLAAPIGLLFLAIYSAGIEWTQLHLARIDRACDVTDIIDNVTGAALGVGAGLAVALLLRAWRRHAARPAA